MTACARKRWKAQQKLLVAKAIAYNPCTLIGPVPNWSKVLASPHQILVLGLKETRPFAVLVGGHYAGMMYDARRLWRRNRDACTSRLWLEHERTAMMEGVRLTHAISPATPGEDSANVVTGGCLARLATSLAPTEEMRLRSGRESTWSLELA